MAGGSGLIGNGKFSFTIGTPDELWGLNEGSNFINSRFKITQSDPPSRYYPLYLDDTEYFASRNYSFDNRSNYRNSQNLRVNEWEIYVYAETDVTVTGTGESITSGATTTKGTDFTIKLKEGWNTLVRTRVAKNDANTDREESLKIGKSSSAAWTLALNP
jgi:hypothetical protein